MSIDGASPKRLGPPPIPLEQRMMRHILVGDGCWEWQGSRNPKGYGRVQVGTFADPQVKMAHRVMYEFMVGPIPEGMCLDHLCRNPPCVRPDHLEVVTLAENTRRGVSWQASKTHCAKGHPYDETNTSYLSGRRRCRICVRQWGADYRARRRG